MHSSNRGLVYIHIPFCKSFCAYCGFYSSTAIRHKTALLEAVLKEYDLRKNPSSAIGKTLYLGGGTPSVCTAQEIAHLIYYVSQFEHKALNWDEITVEVNPSDIDALYLETLLKAGVNRLSMGIQSLHNPLLKAMHRRHDQAQALHAFYLAREAGFKNISVDLIFGLPYMDTTIWKETLQGIMAIRPEHISAYQLSIEKNSTWGKMFEKGQIPLPDETLAADEYSLLQAFLSDYGYEQYEVSNFSLPGFYSRHNSAYWERIPYLGLGPAAHSFDGTHRTWNVSNILKYLEHINNSSLHRTGETLTAEQVYDEWVMLGLRTTKGIDIQRIERECGTTKKEYLLSQATPFIDRGQMIHHANHLSIDPHYLFVSDDIIRHCLFG